MGQIRDLEHEWSRETAQRIATENTTLKQRVRQLATENRTLAERLEAARSNNRFADRRIAQLEARLLEHPAGSHRARNALGRAAASVRPRRGDAWQACAIMPPPADVMPVASPAAW